MAAFLIFTRYLYKNSDSGFRIWRKSINYRESVPRNKKIGKEADNEDTYHCHKK